MVLKHRDLNRSGASPIEAPKYQNTIVFKIIARMTLLFWNCLGARGLQLQLSGVFELISITAMAVTVSLFFNQDTENSFHQGFSTSSAITVTLLQELTVFNCDM